MCGRYGSWSSDTVLAERFGAAVTPETALVGASWNRAPGSDIRVVIERSEGASVSAGSAASAGSASGAVSEDDGPVRRLRVARWGLLPSWAKDIRLGYKTFNARSETAAAKPAFRASMRSFRAVVPADCWYEWQRLEAPDGASRSARAPKRPWAVSRADGEPLALAGLCSWWRPAAAAEPDGAAAAGGEGPAWHGSWLLTCTILTRAAGEDLSWLHDREPVVLDDDLLAGWLDPTMRDGELASELLRAPRPALRWWEVGAGVGSTRADGPELARPIDPASIVSQA